MADFVFRLALATANAGAFTGWIAQWRGCIGNNGILPAARFLDAVMQLAFADTQPFEPDLAKLPSFIMRKLMCAKRALQLTPSIFAVIGAQDVILEASLLISYLFVAWLAFGGSTLSAVLSCCSLATLWGSHLAVAKPFLSLQMDTKLVEINLLFAATYAFRDSSPSLWVWAMRLLAARIMVACGVAKFSGNDPAWRDLGMPAMQWHYFTQPLPNSVSRYMHFLPVSVHSLEVLGTYFVECAVPLAYFSHDARARALAAALTLAFNAAIGSSGNYGHLHLIMYALSVAVLVDTTSCDASYAPPPAWIMSLSLPCPQSASLWYLPMRFALGLLGWLLLLAYCAVAIVPLSQTFNGLVSVTSEVPGWATLRKVYDRLARLHIVGYYSKFTHMTKFRWELQLEGTVDQGRTWVPFEYLAKPGGGAASLDRQPRTLVPGYRPTLDWRQWFVPLAAARIIRRGGTLNSLPVEPWYRAFEEKVLQGSPDVLALVRVPQELEHAAQAGTLHAVRTVIYDYRFTDRELRAELEQHRIRQAAIAQAMLEAEEQKHEQTEAKAQSPKEAAAVRKRNSGRANASEESAAARPLLGFTPDPFHPSRAPLQPNGCEKELVPDSYLRGVPWEIGSVWSRRRVCLYDCVVRQGVTLLKQGEERGTRLPGQPDVDFPGLDD